MSNGVSSLCIRITLLQFKSWISHEIILSSQSCTKALRVYRITFGNSLRSFSQAYLVLIVVWHLIDIAGFINLKLYLFRKRRFSCGSLHWRMTSCLLSRTCPHCLFECCFQAVFFLGKNVYVPFWTLHLLYFKS